MTHTTKITADAACTMGRFDFIALYLVVATRRAENRGRLGYRVQHAHGEYRVFSPIAGGTVGYRTTEADKLFDYVRRGQLGTLVREAKECVATGERGTRSTGVTGIQGPTRWRADGSSPQRCRGGTRRICSASSTGLMRSG